MENQKITSQIRLIQAFKYQKDFLEETDFVSNDELDLLVEIQKFRIGDERFPENDEDLKILYIGVTFNTMGNIITLLEQLKRK